MQGRRLALAALFLLAPCTFASVVLNEQQARASRIAGAVTALRLPVASATPTTQAARWRRERGWDLNDLRATPGAVIKTATRAQVCQSGYSATVRNVSDATKNAVYAEYGITTHRAYQYEIDHLVSLELGGSNSIKNLWPEPNDRKYGNTKDGLEAHLHALVCKGSLNLATAQKAIATDWVRAYATYWKPLPAGHNPTG